MNAELGIGSRVAGLVSVHVALHCFANVLCYDVVLCCVVLHCSVMIVLCCIVHSVRDLF